MSSERGGREECTGASASGSARGPTALPWGRERDRPTRAPSGARQRRAGEAGARRRGGRSPSTPTAGPAADAGLPAARDRAAGPTGPPVRRRHRWNGYIPRAGGLAHGTPPYERPTPPGPPGSGRAPGPPHVRPPSPHLPPAGPTLDHALVDRGLHEHPDDPPLRPGHEPRHRHRHRSSGLDVAEGRWSAAAYMATLLAVFAAGRGAVGRPHRARAPSAVGVHLRAPHGRRVRPARRSSPCWSTGTRSATSAHETAALWLTLLPSLAMGLQNATITRISGGVVRTTHVTGVLTDLGHETAIWALRRRDAAPRPCRDQGTFASGWRLLLLASIVLSFAFGAGLGTARVRPLPALVHGARVRVPALDRRRGPVAPDRGDPEQQGRRAGTCTPPCPRASPSSTSRPRRPASAAGCACPT